MTTSERRQLRRGEGGKEEASAMLPSGKKENEILDFQLPVNGRANERIMTAFFYFCLLSYLSFFFFVSVIKVAKENDFPNISDAPSVQLQLYIIKLMKSFEM